MLDQHRFTVPAALQDHPEWRRNRTDYALWLIRADGDAIGKRVAAARKHLAGYLLEPYRRQPHVTICVCGFPAKDARLDDDFADERFDAQVQAVTAAAMEPFPLVVGGLHSFASAPFLEVRDGSGRLEQLRRTLLLGGSEIGRSTFVPHVTVGLYAGAYPAGEVLERMRSFPPGACDLLVDRITYAAYEARDPAGPLTMLHELPLRGR